MTSYGYIIMIIVDSCIIWFYLDCIMQLKKSYYTASNVCSRKSATTFGDLPDWYNHIETGPYRKVHPIADEHRSALCILRVHYSMHPFLVIR